MEFLAEYGLFLAKTLTFLVALALAVAIIAGAAQKQRRHRDDDEIDIEKLNERFEDYKDTVLDAVLDDDAKKQRKKDEKNARKAEKKQRKKKSQPDSGQEAASKKRVYVLDFEGDIKASETESLSKLISAVLTQARPVDEVVVRLESGGGMVHSYGFAASQLARITAKSIPLTICVDKVAASGGYMMACVADKILAAPFAIIGSIGVIAQIPNFNRLLKKADIDYEMHTAGEYKRTLTMFGENTDKGREKFTEELEDTHRLFKDYVQEHRPALDVAQVATGEIWFGRRAIELQLIDELKTSDEYIFELSESADVFLLSISHKPKLAERLGLEFSKALERVLLRSFNVVRNRYFS